MDTVEHSQENVTNTFATPNSKQRRRFSVRVSKGEETKTLSEQPTNAISDPLTPSGKGGTLKRNESLSRTLSTIKEFAGSLKGSLKKKLSAHVQSLLDIKPTKIFGQHLEEVVEKEKSLGVRDGVPTIVAQCISYLLPAHVNEEGLFRVSGALESIQRLKLQVDHGENMDWESIDNPHDVAGLLKMFVREIPAPLIPQDKQDAFIVTGDFDNRDMQKEVLFDRISDLPLANLRLLRRLFNMLAQVAAQSAQNKMGAANLATVWGPNIFWNERQEVDPHKMIEYSRQVNAVVQIMIEEEKVLFRERDFERIYSLHVTDDSPAPVLGKKRSRDEFVAGSRSNRRSVRSEMIPSYDAVLTYNGAGESETDDLDDLVDSPRKRFKPSVPVPVTELAKSLRDSPKKVASIGANIGKKISRRLSEKPPSKAEKAQCLFFYFDESKQTEGLKKLMASAGILPLEIRNDQRDPIGFDEVMRLVKDVSQIVIVKNGESSYMETHPLSAGTDEATIRSLVENPTTGRLRAPSIILGKSLVVGFDKSLADTFKFYLFIKK